jgi:hypothetical protein
MQRRRAHLRLSGSNAHSLARMHDTEAAASMHDALICRAVVNGAREAETLRMQHMGHAGRQYNAREAYIHVSHACIRTGQACMQALSSARRFGHALYAYVCTACRAGNDTCSAGMHMGQARPAHA